MNSGDDSVFFLEYYHATRSDKIAISVRTHSTSCTCIPVLQFQYETEQRWQPVNPWTNWGERTNGSEVDRSDRYFTAMLWFDLMWAGRRGRQWNEKWTCTGQSPFSFWGSSGVLNWSTNKETKQSLQSGWAGTPITLQTPVASDKYCTTVLLVWFFPMQSTRPPKKKQMQMRLNLHVFRVHYASPSCLNHKGLHTFHSCLVV